jgi:hypothetical protein
MKHHRVLFCATLLCLAAAASLAQEGDKREERTLAPGVTYTHIMKKTPAGEPWSIHLVEMSRKERWLELRAVRAAEPTGEMQRERPTAMAQRATASGVNVVAVVNGDYDLAEPYLGISDGLAVTGREISTTGKPTWPAMGVTSSGEPVIGVPQVEMELELHRRKWKVAALNKPLGTTWGTGPYLYTREFRATVKNDRAFRAVVIGKLTRSLPLRLDQVVSGTVEEIFEGATQVPIPAEKLVLVEALAANNGTASLTTMELRPGQKVKLRIRVRMNGRKKIRDVVGGFPVLVEGGAKHIVGEPKPLLAQRHPRTALCTNEQKIIFVVVDGRQPQLSVGMTLDELADLMVGVGCTTAMNTDGGGSSVMAVREESATSRTLQIVNSPSDGQERGRGNAWIVVKR